MSFFDKANADLGDISDQNIFYLYLSHESHERQRCPFLETLFCISYMLAGQTDVQIEPSSIGQASKRRHGCQLLKTLFSKSCLAAGEGSMLFLMELSEICSTHFCLFAGKNDEFQKYEKQLFLNLQVLRSRCCNFSSDTYNYLQIET